MRNKLHRANLEIAIDLCAALTPAVLDSRIRNRLGNQISKLVASAQIHSRSAKK